MLSNGVSIHTICRHSQLLASLLRSFLLVSGVEPRDVAVSPQTVVLGVSLTHRWMVFNHPSLLTDNPPSIAHQRHHVDLNDIC